MYDISFLERAVITTIRLSYIWYVSHVAQPCETIPILKAKQSQASQALSYGLIQNHDSC